MLDASTINISGGEAYFPKAKTNSSAGVAILFNKSFKFKEKCVIADPEGHFISICLSHHNFHFQLINVYGPNTRRENFYENLDDIIPFSGPLVIAGDFNFTEKPLDREGPGKFAARNQKGSLSFSKIKTKYSLTDTWRSINPYTQEFTYYEPPGKNLIQVKSRLDRFYLSDHFTHDDNKAESAPWNIRPFSYIMYFSTC